MDDENEFGRERSDRRTIETPGGAVNERAGPKREPDAVQVIQGTEPKVALAAAQLPDNYPLGLASFCAISVLLAVWLGYALGAALAQADRWT